LHGARDHGFFVMSRHDYGEGEFLAASPYWLFPRGADFPQCTRPDRSATVQSASRSPRQPFRQKDVLWKINASLVSKIRLHNCSKQIEKCPSGAKDPLFMRLSWHG